MPQPLRGVSAARESLRLVVWDEKDWIYLLDQAGSLHGQFRPRGRLASACCADDGSAYGACGARGEVWWLRPDLSTAWEAAVPRCAIACALDSFGQHLAVSDANGGLHLFDANAHVIFCLQSPRPFHHLAFAPSEPHLFACADYGLVACIDPIGRWMWRDGLVAHMGGISVSGKPENVFLACYSECVQRYTFDGKRDGTFAARDSSRLVAVSYEGNVVVTAGLTERIHLLDSDGNSIGTHVCDSAPVALSVSAIGDHVVLAHADGRLTGWRFSP
jgi:hypothetical protein